MDGVFLNNMLPLKKPLPLSDSFTYLDQIRKYIYFFFGGGMINILYIYIYLRRLWPSKKYVGQFEKRELLC